MSIADYLHQSIEALTASVSYPNVANVDRAIDLICDSLSAGKPLLVCGNGGSAADALHMTGELVGRFLLERKALNCICLCSNPSLLTAWSNDYTFDSIFARQVEAHGKPGGTLVGISTSGNSKNVVKAFGAALDVGMSTVALTGQGGGEMADLSSVLIDVPSRSTPLIQQVHICIYHYICMQVELRLAS